MPESIQDGVLASEPPGVALAKEAGQVAHDLGAAVDDAEGPAKIEPAAALAVPLPRPKLNSWWRVLVAGLGAFLVGVFLLVFTRNPNLFPTVVMVGNFAVPAAYVAFFYERRHLSRLTMPVTMRAILYGGLLGVFAASVLEPLLVVGDSVFFAFVVGLVEEFAKILGVLWIARRRRHDSALDGMILGAAAGMGFAALESMGYAFTSFMRSGGSLSETVGITLLRGILSPLGHGTWTAILVGMLFRESGPGDYHLNWKVIGTYILVVVLHGLWNGLPPVISEVFSSSMAVLIGQATIGATGLLVLGLLWRQALRLQIAEANYA